MPHSFTESVVENAALDWLKSLGCAVKSYPEIAPRTLAVLRDTLLPRLLSGELRVQDAQRFVDGVDSVDEVDSRGA